MFTRVGGNVKYLIIRNRAGIYGFPKGHVEAGETERQTASREILEETALAVDFIDGFRIEDRYKLKDGTDKTVVYFLASFDGTGFSKQDSEIASIELLSFDQACDRFQFARTRRILVKANDFLSKL